MVPRNLMVGISLLALGAGTAAAQTTTNTSEVSQTGTDNSTAVDNNRPGSEQNRSTIIQNGRRNSASVLQIGDFNGSQIRQVGNENLVVHSSRGDANNAESIQTRDLNRSAIRQAGEGQNGSVTQDGNRNLSQIAQGVDAGSNSNFDTNGFFDPLNGTARAGNGNRATVSQVGDDFSSTIRQRASASGVSAGDNRASVRQRGSGNSSNVLQESRGNSATVLQLEGGTTNATRNSTSITQQNTGATSANNPLSNNQANVAVTGQGNSSSVTQNGQNNVARVSQGLGQGSVTQIDQVGSGDANRAAVGQYGSSNIVTIAQNSVAASASVWQQIGTGNSNVRIAQGTGSTGSGKLLEQLLRQCGAGDRQRDAQPDRQRHAGQQSRANAIERGAGGAGRCRSYRQHRPVRLRDRRSSQYREDRPAGQRQQRAGDPGRGRRAFRRVGPGERAIGR